MVEFYRQRKPLRHVPDRVARWLSRWLFWKGLRFEVVDTMGGAAAGVPTDFIRAWRQVGLWNDDAGHERWLLRRVTRPLDRGAHVIRVASRDG